jgi:lipopolysaccharide/colanic/teichoic acid biosynthesis glycosyltransferase
MIAKERARVDRNNHVFSLISFEVGTQKENIDSINILVHQLKTQIRITDEIGWLDNHSIGVLLFNALDAEAKLFIDKIYRNCSQQFLGNYSISTYPEGIFEHPHHDMSGPSSIPGDRRSTENLTAKNLQPIFFDKTKLGKRLGDIVLSSIALIVLSPLMLVVAIAVKLTSKGPVLFKQQRAGLGGAPFTFFKFRTMYTDAERHKSDLLQFNERTGPVFKMENDPRITRLGVHLRKWSLDELPQFINVLKGDMSLVGPRPPTMDEVEKYESWHKYRLEVKPGITCIWQVYARHEKSFENWVRLDIKYKRERSFLLDMKLIILTLPAILSRRGAC